MAVKRHHHLFRRNTELVSRAIDDALVGLVRDEPGDVLGAITRIAENSLDHVSDRPDGIAEYVSALHPQMTDRLRGGWPAVDIKLLLMPAIGSQSRGQDPTILPCPRLLLQLQHNRTCPVTKQNAGGAVLPVENTRESLRTDDQRALEGAATQQSVSPRQPIDKT